MAGSTVFPFSGDLLLLNVASDAQHFDVIDPFHVIAHVQFVEIERDVKGGISGREKRCADESDDEFGAVFKRSVDVSLLLEKYSVLTCFTGRTERSACALPMATRVTSFVSRFQITRL